MLDTLSSSSKGSVVSRLMGVVKLPWGVVGPRIDGYPIVMFEDISLDSEVLFLMKLLNPKEIYMATTGPITVMGKDLVVEVRCDKYQELYGIILESLKARSVNTNNRFTPGYKYGYLCYAVLHTFDTEEECLVAFDGLSEASINQTVGEPALICNTQLVHQMITSKL